MLKVLPRDFSSLFSILFCNAVPRVGGTLRGVLIDNASKRKGWGRGGEENKLSAAPSKSACEPVKDFSSSPNRSSRLCWYLHPTSVSKCTNVSSLF